MAEKDITEKILEDYNDVFADIVNVLLFKGEKRVNPDELMNSSVHSQYKTSDSTLHEEERDVSKFWKTNNIKIALYGIENQTIVEKKMPLRIFGYEGASYREQLKQPDLYPVVTVILYFGTESHWNAPVTLKGLIDVPEYLDEFVNDVKINVYEVAWFDKETVNKFTSDFKIVANFFVNKRKNKDYIPDDKSVIKHVDEVLKLLSVMTGDNRYEEILADGKEGVTTMCEVAERLENRGFNKGNIKGYVDALLDMDISKEKIAEKIMVKFNLTKEEAVSKLEEIF